MTSDFNTNLDMALQVVKDAQAQLDRIYPAGSDWVAEVTLNIRKLSRAEMDAIGTA
jgi:hypothetical protein